MSITRIGYMDQIDFLHEVGEAAGGTTVYASVNDILNHCPCALKCGVVKVKISKVENAMIAGLESVAEKDKTWLANHYREQAVFFRKKADNFLALADQLLPAEAALSYAKTIPSKKNKNKRLQY